MTFLGLSLLAVTMATVPLPVADAEAKKPTNEAALSLAQALDKLRKGNCGGVAEAAVLLQQSKELAGHEAVVGQITLAEKRLARRGDALGCSESPQGAEAKKVKPQPKERQQKTPAALRGEAVPGKARDGAGAKVSKPRPVKEPEGPQPPPTDLAESVYADYLAAKEIADGLLNRCVGSVTPENSDCKQSLDLARLLQAELALEALRVLPERDSRWNAVRQEIGVILGDAQKLMEGIETQIITGGLTAESARALLEAPRDKLDLAERLAQTDNNAAIWGIFFETAKETFSSTELEAIQKKGAKVDWAVVFAHLRSLSDDKWNVLHDKMVASGTWDPHVSQRRDELRVVYVLHDGLTQQLVQDFTDRFSVRISDISALGGREPEIRSDLSREAVSDLIEHGADWMAKLLSCRAEAPETSQDPFRFRLFCGTYVGVLIVEIQKNGAEEANSELRAVARWVRRNEPKPYDPVRRSRQVTFQVSPTPELASVTRERAESLAQMVVQEGSLFPLQAEILNRGCEKCKPCPPQPMGAAWHAFLFAGTPYFEDPRTSSTARGLTSGLDILSLFGSVAAMRWSIHKRNQFASGDEQALGPADDSLKAAGYLLGSMIVIRSLAALCYWNDTCRGWTYR